MRYTCVLCGAGRWRSGGSDKPPATYHCHACHGRKTMIPVDVQRMVREQIAQQLEKQHTWITNIAAANIIRNTLEK